MKRMYSEEEINKLIEEKTQIDYSKTTPTYSFTNGETNIHLPPLKNGDIIYTNGYDDYITLFIPNLFGTSISGWTDIDTLIGYGYPPEERFIQFKENDRSILFSNGILIPFTREL